MVEWEELGLDEEIIEEFIGESVAGLDKLGPTLLHLEEQGLTGIDAIFRWVHTVKGTSGFFNLSEIQSFAHKFETYLQKLKSGQLTLTHSVVNLTREGVELMSDALDKLQQKIIHLGPEFEEFVNELPLDVTSTDQETSIDNVLKRLGDVTTSLEEKRDNFKDKGISQDVLTAVAALEEYLKKIEDFKVQVVVKALTLESVINSEGQDLTEYVKTVLEAVEDVMLVGVNAKSLKSKSVSFATETIHYSLFPDAEKKKFQWDALAELIELMPEIVEDFWQKFWFESLEGHATIKYFASKDLARQFESQLSQEDGIDLEHQKETDAPPPESVDKEPGQPSNQEQTLRVDSEYLERFMRRTEALVMNRNYMENLGHELKKHVPTNVSMEFREGIDDLEQNIEDLQKYLFKVRSTRISELFERMPRMVRKLEKDLGKSVRLLTKGEEIEVDRSMITILSDIFVHVIRNSIDHGIETPQERLKIGKPETGTINIIAHKDEDTVSIEIMDDGKGVNQERVLQKAIDSGLAEKDKHYEPSEIFGFLLKPGFSTAKEITNVSGRGVGMDVVASAIYQQGGKVDIQSEWKKGTTINLSFPTRKGSLTRDVLLVELDQRKYAVSHDCLKEIIEADKVMTKNNGSQDFFCHRDKLINIVDLSTILHNKKNNNTKNNLGRLMILEDERGNMVAARVDKVLNKMQVVIKRFGHEFLEDNELFEGTVVIGLGQPILVLNLKNAAVLTH